MFDHDIVYYITHYCYCPLNFLQCFLKEVSYAQHLFDPKIHQKQQFCEITLQLKVLVFILSYCNLCDGKATFSGIFTPVSIDTTPNIINVYTVTFDQFNALFLHKV